MIAGGMANRVIGSTSDFAMERASAQADTAGTREWAMISDRSVVQQSRGEPGFVTRRIGGETIVVPVASGVGDLDAIYTFNEVGSRIWSLLEQPIAVKTIVATLSDEYEAPAEQLTVDILELLDALRTRGLIGFTEASGG
jgi:Coenzyme PQQ synthesis protein D (PqqD)